MEILSAKETETNSKTGVDLLTATACAAVSERSEWFARGGHILHLHL